MKNGIATGNTTDKKLDTIIRLLQHLVVLELAQRGVTQDKIGKHIRVAKAAVVEMMDGIKKERRADA